MYDTLELLSYILGLRRGMKTARVIINGTEYLFLDQNRDGNIVIIAVDDYQNGG